MAQPARIQWGVFGVLQNPGIANFGRKCSAKRQKCSAGRTRGRKFHSLSMKPINFNFPHLPEQEYEHQMTRFYKFCAETFQPSPKKKRPRHKYTKEDVERAVKMVLEDKVSIIAAGKACGVPRSTISDKLNDKHKKALGRPTAMTFNEEKKLVILAAKLNEAASGINRKELAQAASKAIQDMPEAQERFVNGVPGESQIVHQKSPNRKRKCHFILLQINQKQ